MSLNSNSECSSVANFSFFVQIWGIDDYIKKYYRQYFLVDNINLILNKIDSNFTGNEKKNLLASSVNQNKNYYCLEVKEMYQKKNAKCISLLWREFFVFFVDFMILFAIKIMSFGILVFWIIFSRWLSSRMTVLKVQLKYVIQLFLRYNCTSMTNWKKKHVNQRFFKI